MSFGSNRRENIYLIGELDTQIYGNKLPSKEQVLKVLFFNIREVKLTIRKSAKLVIDEVKIFWEKARLPIQQESRCIDKVISLHQKWSILQKSAGRPLNVEKEQHFCSDLKNLFDIAHGNILEEIDDKRREFLENQRRDGRIGNINDIEGLYEELEKEEKRRKEIMSQRVAKSQMDINFLDDFAELASTDEDTSQNQSQKSIGAYSSVSLEFEDEHEAGPSAPKRLRGTINIFNDKVVAALDRLKISDRDAVHLVGAITESLNVDTQSLILNRSSIRIYRQKVREARAANIKQVFQNLELNVLVLHWDGKLLFDLVKHEMVDRLPIVVTNGKVEKLLGVPALENSKGITQANAVHEVLEDWGLLETVKAFCCDTTASNLGNKNGSAVLLERLLKRDILFLSCRRHVYELILRSVFENKLPLTTGPNVPLFKNFQKAWAEIDKTRYKSGLEDEEVAKLLTSTHVERISSFVQEALKHLQPRDDYKELLLLTLVFLGSSPSDIKFHYPGAFHHARWMAKAIYCLKIFIFRDQFELTEKEWTAVRDTSIFIVMLYIEAWFTVPLVAMAPNHDLQFLKKLYNYKSIDEEVSAVTLRKFRNHLWYLNPEAAAMSFFDETLSLDVKRKMISELYPFEDIDFVPKRIQVKLNDIGTYCDKEMDTFITPQTRNFFLRFEIQYDFLEIDPALWCENKSYQNGLKIVKQLKVINDVAERGVHFLTEYNNILTKNKDQKQFALQIIKEHQQKFPDARKETVMQNF